MSGIPILRKDGRRCGPQSTPRVTIGAGQRFGKWKVLIGGIGINTPILCKCSCGLKRKVRAASLTRGESTFCKVWKRHPEIRKTNAHKHGETRNDRASKEYVAWSHMKSRCLNPNVREYNLYGGRGIKVCTRWLNSFDNFLADVGRAPSPSHSIERIDVNGDYAPENVCWAPHSAQSRNKRSNIFLEFEGRRLCVADWARLKGIKRGAIDYRIKRGWTVDKILGTGVMFQPSICEPPLTPPSMPK